MRILLLGELSGVHQELKPALEAAGHDVIAGHNRYPYGGFTSDIPFFSPDLDSEGAFSSARELLSQLYHAPKLTGFDIVQIMTPKFFNWKIHERMLRFLKRHNGRLVVVNTSCTSDYHRRVKELAYRPCGECLKFDLKAARCIYDREDERRAEEVAFELSDAIVATHFEYYWALADTKFASKVVAIPLPIDTQQHHPLPMLDFQPVRIWYGETRHGFKGGPFIKAALERLKADEHPNVEIIETERLPFDSYLKLLASVHIVIDQASSYGPGMNALYAMARARVALTGAEPETLGFYAVPASENAMVNVRPSARDIYETLTNLVANPEQLQELGRRSANQIEKYHAANVVAQHYTALYARLLDNALSSERVVLRSAL